MRTTKRSKKLVVELRAENFDFSTDGFYSCCAADMMHDLQYDEEDRYLPRQDAYEMGLLIVKNAHITEEMYENRTFEITEKELQKLRSRVFQEMDGMIFAITASYQKEWESVMELLGFTHVHTYKRGPQLGASILTTWMFKPKGYKI